jgi:UDP-glucuronate 4-epimerase
VSAFARRITAGEAVTIYGDGSVQRDFTHVSDICRGLLAALEAPGVEGHAINLGHGQPLSIIQIVENLAEALGKQVRVEYRAARPEDLPVTHADLTKAREMLGYRPEVEFADGIREFAAWFLSAQRSGLIATK